MSASLIGHSGSSAFRLSTTTAVSMSLTGSCFSSESAPRALVWGFFSQEVYAERRIFFHSSVALFDLKVRSFVPIAKPHLVAKPHLDGFEYDGAAWCGRDDDQRGARFRARFNRATTLYPVGPRT